MENKEVKQQQIKNKSVETPQTSNEESKKSTDIPDNKSVILGFRFRSLESRIPNLFQCSNKK